MINITHKQDSTSLVVTIIAYSLSYTIVYPAWNTTNDMDKVKDKIPVILGLSNKEKLEIRNTVVKYVTAYLKYLRDGK